MAALAKLAALSETWDETKIAGTDDANLIDNYMTQHQRATRERFAVDHQSYADESSKDNLGAHKIVHLLVQSTIQALVNAGCLYTKDVGGVAELHYKDENENEIQITSGGALNGLAEGFIQNDFVLTAASAARSGWTDRTATYTGKYVRVGGTGLATGGNATHLHTGPNHNHPVTGSVSANTDTSNCSDDGGACNKAQVGSSHVHTDTFATSNAGTGNTGSANTDPVYVDMRMYQMD